MAIAGCLLVLVLSTIHFIAVDVSHSNDPRKQVVDEHYYASDPARGEETLSVSIRYVYDNYFWLRRAAWWMFKESPVLGVGAGNYGVALAEYRADGRLLADFPEFETAQSEILDRAAETGIIGLVALIGLGAGYGLTLWRGSRTQGSEIRVDIILGFLVAFIGVAVASIDLDVMKFRFVWIALALGASSVTAGDWNGRNAE